jgi:biopolymer transport protein ExbB
MTVWQYIQSGGMIMYLLVALNVIGISLILWKFLHFNGEKKHIKASAHEILRNIIQANPDFKTEKLLLDLAKDKVYTFSHNLEKGLNTIKIIATIAPLLGLLGTVVGVLSAFQAIAAHGLNDPTIFASGISMALITTVGGLIVAIPHFISYNYLSGWLTSFEVKLEDNILDSYVSKDYQI